MGRAKLVPGVSGKGIDLNGHDQWIEVYRDEALEISGDQLTLSLMGFPQIFKLFSGYSNNKRELAVWDTSDRERFTGVLSHDTMKKKSRTALPENWENNWHHVIATYDGKEMYLTY